ncbi:hypothetical protein H4219_002225 [Mycoemilia scoparia]|uniref:Uncharacterized protein n=1 Tax=Mycoemilia scoparia TaxID=417184 RepID=A0A9W8DUP8_9FUNG|nr:hypothetical protein H4219_002225 [Mycoemilia scoparia]
MSALDLDQSLDSIIKSSGPRGGSRRRGGGRGRRDNRNSPYNRDRRAKGQQTTVQVQVPVPFTGLQQGIAPQTSNEISISNLKYDVTADDLKASTSFKLFTLSLE